MKNIIKKVSTLQFQATTTIVSISFNFYTSFIRLFKEIELHMRLPYIPKSPAILDAEGKAVLGQISARRGENGHISLYRALIHSPIVSGGCHSFFGAIYSGSTLRADLLELAVCRVALLKRAWYQYDGHVKL